MGACKLVVALTLSPLLALAGCARIERLVTYRPQPECVLYFGAPSLPDRPDIADTRHEPHTASVATAGAVARQRHAYLEISEIAAVGTGQVLQTVVGYVTWF